MRQPDDHGLTFRQDYFGDPAAWAALVDLLRDIFSIDVGVLHRFGGPDPTSMPFGYFDESGTCVANFSLFSMAVIVAGRRVNAAGFQSGAVRPQWRGRGLYSTLLKRAFAWSEQRFEAGWLLTDKPALYEPYGFRAMPQHFFVGEPPAAGPTRVPATALILPEDGTAIRAMLSRRMPVSQDFAVTQQIEMFFLNACFDPDIRLSLLAEDGAVVAWKFEGACLTLLDVVARTMPSLASIVAALGCRPERVETCFPTDLLDWRGSVVPYPGPTVLMARGIAAGDIRKPIMLSPMAAF